jgi:hypothetical protein
MFTLALLLSYNNINTLGYCISTKTIISVYLKVRDIGTLIAEVKECRIV